jgi:hypothetical protein
MSRYAKYHIPASHDPLPHPAKLLSVQPKMPVEILRGLCLLRENVLYFVYGGTTLDRDVEFFKKGRFRRGVAEICAGA